MSSPITIKDIAKALNISASTVSRALKDHPDISRETKKAVNDLAAKLRYKPNAVALSLKNSRTNTIGVIVPELVHFFFSSVISGIEDVAYDAGYNVMVCQSNEMYSREIINTQALDSNRVEGALVSISKETHDFAHLLYLEENGIPLVFFDRAPEELDVDKVIIDDYKAAYNATTHLIETGCKRIAHLAAPQTLGIGIQRMAGYKKALEDHGITYREDWVIEADSFELAGDATRNLMHLPTPPDAIFAVNDMTAVGAMKTLQRMSIAVPQKVAIIGFSAGFFSDITTPTLSSVDQHGYEMGVEAAKLLLQRIETPVEGKHKTQYIDTHLVLRESTKRKN
ncbi:MAG: LacI family transcriptional regulator [Prolixibacteraceae bacterium]|jgi:LacI family transcriptional regulator|nr:LacI family transcriptional regulator [Prolixibacteraceae bacterium]